MCICVSSNCSLSLQQYYCLNQTCYYKQNDWGNNDNEGSLLISDKHTRSFLNVGLNDTKDVSAVILCHQ